MSSEKIDLTNCDFSAKGKRVNTPRSIEALNLIGVKPDELHKISLETYISRHPECKNLPKELIQERYDNEEKVRNELIKQALEKRNEILAKNPGKVDKMHEKEYMENEEKDDKDGAKLNQGEEGEEKKEEGEEDKKEEGEDKKEEGEDKKEEGEDKKEEGEDKKEEGEDKKEEGEDKKEEGEEGGIEKKDGEGE